MRPDPARCAAATARRLAFALAALALLASAPAASADIVFGTFGSAAGQTSEPRGVAVDESNGNLYVADRKNNRIDVFEPDGDFIRAFGWGVSNGANELQTCTSACQAGIAGSGPGQLGGPGGIAVDDDPASPAFHDVYVFDDSNRRIQRFHPDGEFVLAFGSAGSGVGQFEEIRGIGVGPGGVVYVADSKSLGSCKVPGTSDSEFLKRVQKFKPSGEAVEQLLPSDAPCGAVQAFAVDAAGAFYLANDNFTGAVRKYGPSGTPLATFNPSFNIHGLAVNPAGNVYVTDHQPSPFGAVLGVIEEYDPSGNQMGSFGYGSIDLSPQGLAFFHTAAGDLFAGQGPGTSSRIVHFPLPPPGPIVLPEAKQTKADPIGNVKATLNAAINPEGKASTYRFQYVEDATYQKDVAELGAGHGFDHARETAELPLGSSDFNPHLASATAGCADVPKEQPEGKCLTPETLYRFRAIASNADAPGGNVGPEASFTTKAPVELSGVWSTEVGEDAAVLHAAVNPLGIPATGRFQYVDQESFEESGFAEASETPSIDFGSGEAQLSKAAQLTSLAPGTAYRYRIVGSNPFVASVLGPQGSFTTFPAAAEASGDCPNEEFRSALSAKLPGCRAYELVSPLDKANGDIVVLNSVVDSDAPAEVPRAAEDGSKLAYSSYRPFGDAPSGAYTVQYLAERRADGWRTRSLTPPREGASVYETFGLETEYRVFSDDLCSAWLLHDVGPLLAPGAIPGYGNLYRRDDCGAEPGYEAITTVKPPTTPSKDFIPEAQGGCGGGLKTIFRADDKLTKDASKATDGSGKPIYQLYGASGGGLDLVSVLPGGAASGQSSHAGVGEPPRFRRASLTGAVAADCSAVFWTDAASVPGRIYLRANPFAPGKECSAASSPCSFPVSEAVGGEGSDGPARFWLGAEDGSRAIFTFTGGKLAGNLYEYLTASKTTQLIAKGVGGVLGASKDATRVYFSSKEALDAGAVAGEENLYLHDASKGPEAASFIATISSADPGACFVVVPDPFRRCARVSADGEVLAFMSTSSLTGYDNTDAASEEADAEVFLYGAEEDELRCVSCNPSGGRPAGREVGTGAETGWVAAQLPTPLSGLNPSRALSPDGERLFFLGYDSLLPRDTNGKADLYLWEQASSEEECDQKKAELYVPASGGCISLLSSGQGRVDVEFVDASASGDDVFFKASESLVSWDPGLIDVYDARVGGGFPPPPAPEPPCEGEACQPAVSPPPLQTPSSSTVRGPGNPVSGEPRPRCPKGKRKVRRAGKSRCVTKQQARQQRKTKAKNHRRAGR